MTEHDEKRRRLADRPGYDSYRPMGRELSRDTSSSSRDRARKFTKESLLRENRSYSRQLEASANPKSPPTGPRLKEGVIKPPTLSSPLPQSSDYSPPSPSRGKALVKSSTNDSVWTVDDGNSVFHDSALPKLHSSSLSAGPSTEDSEVLGKTAIKRMHDGGNDEPTTKTPRTENDSDIDKLRVNDSRKLCKNFNCLGEHGYQECPLPKICWGCRSTGHYWSYCPMTCTKCESARHTAKYCVDFEINSTGKSQPKAPRREATDNTIGRDVLQQRKIYSVDLASGLKMQQQSSSSVARLKEEPESSPLMGNTVLANDPANRILANTSSQELAADFLDGLDEIQVPKGPAISSGKGNYPPYPPNTGMYNDKGEKIYCNQWLRWGDCSYYNTSLGCKFKHEIPPDHRTQRDIGLRLDSPWLQGAPFAGLSTRNGRTSRTWSTSLFAPESRSSQEPIDHPPSHGIYRPQGGVGSYEPSTASEDRYNGLRHKTRLYSDPVEEPSNQDYYYFGRPSQNFSYEAYHPTKEDTIYSASNTVGDLEQRAISAESIAQKAQAEVVRLAHVNAASYKREEAKKIAKINLADAEIARSLVNKAAARASKNDGDTEKARINATNEREKLPLSQTPAKATPVSQEARRGSTTLPNTAYPTPTSQTHDGLWPGGFKSATKPGVSSILPAIPVSKDNGVPSSQNPAKEDSMTAMLKAFEEEQAEEERKHAATMAAKAAKQKQELESHLKRKAYDAKRKREEEERRMDEEHLANIKRLRGLEVTKRGP